ncbi:MAG: proliferating cell nuclear antigen (pcna) [Candidatus Diapherotrites archaeon]|uniref:DNA polymerase sliding clamp n=1 Tax=Candidatus Iainarchaeum sp. TaxID=3101447 RepID=A0A7J4JTV3_9ARCH|nr:proliferating cell nuclear antigen (pcna) [Candidatus Diapherotrites archaeon]HIH21088.1 proliferating cell nuclear antigen (pcna) [Candidatus Diapherotrites archaeon]HIH33438.1 proliferating cell nuclear antigen (pcna) [Candidatus Diapherotrites archaeon]
MARLVLENAAEFRKCIEAISVLIDEAEFVLEKDSLSLKATDPSQISMVDFRLPKKAFKEFELSSPSKIGLDLDYLSQIVSRAKASDVLEIELDSENSRLKLSFKGSSKRSFNIPLLDISRQELPTPKIEFEASLKIKAGELQEGLKDASLIASHITIGVQNDNFIMKANSSKGFWEHESSKKDGALVELQVKKEGTAMFPLDYLQDMLKAASSDTIVSIGLKANHPVNLAYNIGEASISYYLAPRIES